MILPANMARTRMLSVGGWVVPERFLSFSAFSPVVVALERCYRCFTGGQANTHQNSPPGVDWMPF
jgi:hypothetical protein